MTQPEPEPIPQRIEFATTPEVEAGTYANFVSVWALPDCFTMDFSVFTKPPQLVEDDDGRKFLHMPARVVARVRIPPAQVFELMKALNLQLTAWEVHTGNKRPDPDQRGDRDDHGDDHGHHGRPTAAHGQTTGHRDRVRRDAQVAGDLHR